MATILVGTLRGDCEEGRDAFFSPSPPPPLFCPYHAGYWYRRLQRHDLTAKLRTINSLARLFLTQDMSIVIPLVERITILIEGKWISWSTLGPPWIQNCFLGPKSPGSTLVRQMITDRSAITTFNSYFRRILNFQQTSVWGNWPSSLVTVFSISLMSLFICFNFFLVLSVRKNIVSRINLSSHNFHWEQFKVDVWKTRKQTSGIQNRNGNSNKNRNRNRKGNRGRV